MPTAQELLDSLGVEIPPERQEIALRVAGVAGVETFPSHVLTELVMTTPVESLRELLDYYVHFSMSVVLQLGVGDYIVEFDVDGDASIRSYGYFTEMARMSLLIMGPHGGTSVTFYWVTRED